MAQLPREAFDPFLQGPETDYTLREPPSDAPVEEAEVAEKQPMEPLDEELANPLHIQALDTAASQDPNEVAEVIRLGQEVDIPESVIAADPEKARKIAWMNSLRPGDMGTRSPKTAAWLSDPRHAAVAKDDIPTLEEIERRIAADDAMGDSVVDLGGIVDTWLVGLAKMYETSKMLSAEMQEDYTVYGMIDKTAREDAQAKGDQDMIRFLDKRDKARQDFIQKQRGLIEEAEQVQQDLTPKQMGMLLEGIRGGVTMMMDMAPGLAASIATRGKFNPTLVFLSGKAFTEGYGSARLENMEFEKAMRYGMIDGALEYYTERMPTKSIEKILKNIGKDGLKREVKQWLIREAMTEQLATASQSLNAALHGLDDELINAYDNGDWGEIIEIQGRRQAVTAIATVVGGGTMSGSINALNRYMTKDQRAMRESISGLLTRQNSQQAQEGLDNILFLAQSSKTNERAASVFNDFIETVGKDKKIYIAADVVRELDDPPQSLLDQLEDNSGGNVEMPLSEFLTHFAVDTAKLDLVRRYVKTNEALKTMEELEQDTNSDYIKNVLQRAAEAKETRTEAERIHENIAAQLVKTGRITKAHARKSAEIIPAMATVQYEEYKKLGVKKADGSEITLEDVFADMGLKIKGPATTGQQDIDIDETKFLNQKEYDEYEQATARGLEMTQEAREQRAAEQGWTQHGVLYRGERRADVATVGQHSERGAITFAPSTQTANIYAESMWTPQEGDAPTVTPAYVKIDNPVPVDRVDPFISINDLIALGVSEEMLLKAAMDQDSDIGLYEMYEAYLYNDPTGFMDLADVPQDQRLGSEEADGLYGYDELTPEWALQNHPEAFKQISIETFRVFDMPEIVEAMRALGYDGVIHPGMGDNYGEFEYRVFDPRQIKSIYSAFDPDYEEVLVLSQTQDLGDVVIEENARDTAGNPVTIRQSAQSLWDDLQERIGMVDMLRDCANA